MNLMIFNGCILFGWCLVTIGGIVLNKGAGMVASGLLLIGLTVFLARLGGLFSPQPKDQG